MEKFKEKLPFLTIIILCCTFLYTCNTNSNIKRVLEKSNGFKLSIDSLKHETSKLQDSIISINQLELLEKCKSFKLSIDSLKNETSKLQDSTISINYLEILLELEGYKQSSRNLYHNNAIIRSKERPDDVMHGYNVKIDELTKQLR